MAVEGEALLGFGDNDASGYLDRLYVHKDFQRQGVASALCGALERAVEGERTVTCASITARPFFESRGYRLVRERRVVMEAWVTIRSVPTVASSAPQRAEAMPRR